MSINRVMKIKSLHSLHYWDLTKDGMYKKERIKGKNKKIINKARRRFEKELAKKRGD